MLNPRRYSWTRAVLIAICINIGTPVFPVAGGQLNSPSRPAAQSAARAQPNALRIVVVSGEDAVNIIQQKTAVAPIVEVRDRNSQPVAGAIVTFSIQGSNATFAAGANTLTLTTNAVGQAAVTGLTPTGAGAVQINVAAAFQGQTATAAITQTNFATAAQAASASAGSGASSGSTGGSGGGGGGLGAGAITGITAAAAGAVGGLYGYRKYVRGEAPNVENVQLFPNVGVQGATPISVAGTMTWHGDGATATGDFGDGTQITVSADGGIAQRLDHVYSTAGTFTVRLTLTDAWDRASSGQATVLIKSLTARWNVGATGSFFTLTQSGSSIAGTFTAASGVGSGIVSGTLRAQEISNAGNTPNLTLAVTPIGTGLPSTFVGSTQFNDTADILVGIFSNGTTNTTVQLLRQ